MFCAAFIPPGNVSFQQSCFPQRCQKVLLHLAKGFAGDNGTRDEHEIERLREFVLVKAESFAEETASAVAHYGAADFSGSDDAEARGGFWRQTAEIGDEATVDKALAFLPDVGEVAALLDALALGEAPARWSLRVQTGVRRLRPTRRRLRRMARPLLVELRLRKPCWRLRRIFEGWYCRFINHLQALSKGLIDNTPLIAAQGSIEGQVVKRGRQRGNYSNDCHRTAESERRMAK